MAPDLNKFLKVLGQVTVVVEASTHEPDKADPLVMTEVATIFCEIYPDLELTPYEILLVYTAILFHITSWNKVVTMVMGDDLP